MRLGFARPLLKALGAFADVVQPPAPGLVVLIYHRVGGRSSIETDLPVGLFEEQIAFLCEHAQIVSLDDGLELLQTTDSEGRNEGMRPVTVTFDDGTADFADNALPVLAANRVPVTLYLATAFVEERRPFPHAGEPISWDALGDAHSTGLVSVGSHTHRHALLDRLPFEDIDDELDRSIGLIGDRLGIVPRHFAYPKAIHGSPVAEKAVRSRFESAALAGSRPNRFGATDPYRLARSPVQVSDGMRWFVRKSQGGLALEGRIRDRVNRSRYRNARS
jgi:Polysaccharide deacetylase